MLQVFDLSVCSNEMNSNTVAFPYIRIINFFFVISSSASSFYFMIL